MILIFKNVFTGENQNVVFQSEIQPVTRNFELLETFLLLKVMQAVSQHEYGNKLLFIHFKNK